MSEYLKFEREMNDRDIKFNYRLLWILIIVLIFTASVLIMNISIIYHDSTKLFNAISTGLLTFTFLFNLQQYVFVRQDYSDAKRMQNIHKKFDLEERMGQDNSFMKIYGDVIKSCPENKSNESINS